jgi:hypothetical protein
MPDEEPASREDNSGGWSIAVVILILIIAGGFLLYEGGYLGGRDSSIDVSLPKVEAPAPKTD